MKRTHLLALALGTGFTLAANAALAAPTVINLTQTGCQFVESEGGVDHGYAPKSAADCNRINGENGAKRVAEAEPLVLKAGEYAFNVKNENVPYELGFYLREQDYDWRNPLHKLTKTAVSGGGLTTGVAKEYVVDLKPGKYYYSCPLNPTPDYVLIVTE